MKKEVTLPDGTKVPALGQGTWHMGDSAARESGEIESLRTGVGKQIGQFIIHINLFYPLASE